MNKTPLNMVLSMMFFKNVKLMFWADVVLCVVYLRNMSPTHALNNNIPYEIWNGHVPWVKHLKIFGTTYYALILKGHGNKLVARNQKCIFLGY